MTVLYEDNHIIAVNKNSSEIVQGDKTGDEPLSETIKKYLKEKYTSPEMIEEATDEEGKTVLNRFGHPEKTYHGDLLEPYLDHIQSNLLTGFDFDLTMLRIAAMNLLLHGINSPAIEQIDTLSQSFVERKPDLAENAFTLILANPPFKGAVDENILHKSLIKKVKTKKTELLFLVLMLRMLREGGRCAVIVPDGVLFGSSNAHVGVRRMLIEDNGLEAVISLPSGVFKPYAGVSTAILIFTKGSETKDVWFYKVENDGYTLDDKRTPIRANDLPDLVERWHKRNPKKDNDRTKKYFFVPRKEIEENKLDLSFSRYAEVSYEEKEYDPPKEILGKLRSLENEIMQDLDELEGMLG